MSKGMLATILPVWCVVALSFAACATPPTPASKAAKTTGMDAAVSPIIDTHIHLWKLPRNKPPMSDDAIFPTGCCGPIPWLERDLLMSEYNATSGGMKIGGVVLVESSLGTPSDKLVRSNQWMLNLAATDDKILSVVGKLDITRPSAIFREQVDLLSADPKWVGLRITRAVFQRGKAISLKNLQPNVIENLTVLAARGRMIDAMEIPGAVVAEIAAAVPNLIIVMDHMADMPATLKSLDSAWLAQLAAVAQARNVYLKVSDVHRLSEKDARIVAWPGAVKYPAVSAPSAYAQVLSAVWKMFGEDRLIFGSNWPVSEFGGAEQDTIELQIKIIEAFLADKGMVARNKIMHDNAMKVYAPRR